MAADETVCRCEAVGLVGDCRDFIIRDGGFTATVHGMRLTTGVIGSVIMSATPAVTAGAAVVFFGARELADVRSAGPCGRGDSKSSATNGRRQAGSILGAALVAMAVCFEAAYTLLSRKLSDGISCWRPRWQPHWCCVGLLFWLSFSTPNRSIFPT